MKVFQFMDLLQPLDTTLEHNYYVQILVVCVCVHYGNGVFGGGRTRLVTHDLCTLCCVCVITCGHSRSSSWNRCNRGTTAEV